MWISGIYKLYERVKITISINKAHSSGTHKYMLFNVQVQEILERVVSIEAKDEDEAIAKVETMYKDEEIVLDADDCNWPEFSIFKQ